AVADGGSGGGGGGSSAEELARAVDACVGEILVRRNADRRTKRSDEVVFVDPDVIGEVVETDRIGQALEEVRARACDRAALPWRVGLAGRGDAGEGKCGFGDGGVDEEQVLRCIDDVVQGEQGTGSRVFPRETG